MPSSKTPAAQRGTATKKTAAPASDDALTLLATDHEEVAALFKAYAKLVKADGDGDERQELARQICEMLTVHAEIEEEIFYPALRSALEADDLLDEAEVEHATVKDLVSQIESMDADDELYDAKVSVLGEYVAHHVQEEENELFPKVRKAGMDLEQLGIELQERKQELMGQPDQ